MKRVFLSAPLALLWLSMLAARGGDIRATQNLKPYFVNVSMTSYDGTSDDLLTAGLGWDGLKSNIPPKVSTLPTAARSPDRREQRTPQAPMR